MEATTGDQTREELRAVKQMFQQSEESKTACERGQLSGEVSCNTAQRTDPFACQRVERYAHLILK